MTVVLFGDLLPQASIAQLILIGLMLTVSITRRSTHQYVKPSLGIYLFKYFSGDFLLHLLHNIQPLLPPPRRHPRTKALGNLQNPL